MFNKQLYQKTHEGNKRILMEIQNFSNRYPCGENIEDK